MRGYDCVVVGGGVAGLSAAMVLGRARRRTLVVDEGHQSNRPAHHVGGLLGHDGIPPADLYRQAADQVRAYDSVVLRDGRVVEARSEGGGFAVKPSDGGEIRAQALVLATGIDYEVPDVPGFAELWGDAVFHCPFCHGWDVRDRRVVVYGAGEIADRQATLLAAWTGHVSRVDPEDVSGVRVEDGTLRALVRRDGSEIGCDAVLVHAALAPPRFAARTARPRADRGWLRAGRPGGAHQRARRLRGRRPCIRTAAGRDRAGQRPPGGARRDPRAVARASLNRVVGHSSSGLAAWVAGHRVGLRTRGRKEF